MRFMLSLVLILWCILLVASYSGISAFASSAWSIQIVDPSGFSGSIDLDSNNVPHISYSSTNGPKYATLAGSKWTIQVSVGSGLLALDSSNNPHLIYPSNVSSGLMYAFWTGSDWEIKSVDLSDNYTLGFSMALDSNGYPHIVYHDATLPVENNGVKYAVWNGLSWATEVVEQGVSVGLWPSIALDTQNNPHICYVDGAKTALKYAVRSRENSGWNIQTIGYTSNDSPSIAVDSSGYPHVSFDDDTLKIASLEGLGWRVQTVDSSCAVYRSIVALDAGDNPHIIYIDTNQNLKYAVWKGSSWSTQTIDADGYVMQASMALDSGCNPHIVYSKLVPGQVISRYFYNLTYATFSGSSLEQPIPIIELAVFCAIILTAAIIIGMAVLKHTKKSENKNGLFNRRCYASFNSCFFVFLFVE